MFSNYDLTLVILSYAVAVIGSLITLMFSKKLLTTSSMFEWTWIAIFAASSLGGVGIWSMHFIGMLAYEETPLKYDFLLTAASLVIAIVVIFIGLFVAARKTPNIIDLIIAGIIVGLGVAAMHYTGMEATRISVEISYNMELVLISIAIAIAAATVALWLMVNVTKLWQMMICALIMGIAVCGMHYTGMAAATIEAKDIIVTSTFDTSVLALFVLMIDVALISALVFCSIVIYDQTKASTRISKAKYKAKLAEAE